MADFKKFVPHVLQWEGLYGNHSWDPGGCTMRGITIGTWKEFGKAPDKNSDGTVNCEDVKLISEGDAITIYEDKFWKRLNAHQINNQQIAEMIADWFITSGWYAVQKTQEALRDSGGKNIVVTSQKFSLNDNDIKALNSLPQQKLYEAIRAKRLAFYEGIGNATAIQGWRNRVNSMQRTTSNSIGKNKKIAIVFVLLIVFAVLLYVFRKDIIAFYKGLLNK